MKTKRLEKKLVLNKTTLSNLDYSRMSKVNAGAGTTGTGHNTIDKYCVIYSCGDCTWTGYPPACPC